VAMPWGLIGILLVVHGVSGALFPRAVWGWQVRRLRTPRSSLSTDDGEITEQFRRIAVIGSAIAAAAGLGLIAVAVAVH
jgi:hypothetical protein